MITEYQPGSYCNDINCVNLKALVLLGAAEYLTEKNELCRDCSAWNFYLWLKAKHWSITATGRATASPGMAAGQTNAPWADPDTEDSSAYRAFFT